MNRSSDRRLGLRIVCCALLGLFAAWAQGDSTQTNRVAAEAGTEPDTPLPLTCPAGAPIGAVNLQVRSPQGAETLQFQSINHLSEGDTVLYNPILHGVEKRIGEVALVMVPAKREPDKNLLIVTDPKAAGKPQEWKIPETIALAVFVYGPQGLSKKKVQGFLSQDDQLIAQLADYAEKTSQTEALLQALSDNASSAASMNSALNGFASQYGFAVQVDRTAPPAVQAQTLFSSMNPQLASYNPLASSASERIGQTASLATAAATLFFGSPIGLAAGGTAMLLELHSIAFPNTQFRSSFAQSLVKQGVNLCGQRTAVPAHTRVAFVWAVRIPNTPTPSIRIGEPSAIAQTLKTAVPVSVPEKEWKYLQRAREWSISDAKGQKTAVKVLKLGNQQALEIDLSKATVASGDYRLNGFWDWQGFQAEGNIHIRPLSDFKAAKLDADSQNRLLTRSGKIAVTLTGSDFEFTNKVELKKLGDEFAVAEPVRFLLPKSDHSAPQERMDVLVDTGALDPGRYALLLSQPDGKSHGVDFSVLPNPPRMDNLPILVNQGAAAQHYVLHGERLDLVKKMEAAGAEITLGDATASGKERSLTVQLKTDLTPGTQSAVDAYLTDRSAPLSLPGALQITGPLPVIASSKLSLPAGMGIALLPGEIPAGYVLSAMLDVKGIEPRSVLTLACAEDVGAKPRLHVGEQNATSSLQQLSQDQLFLSYDTSGFPAGCTLQAALDNGHAGKSDPLTLARIIRLPQIVSFQPGDSKAAADGTRNYILTGSNLEMIEKLGWDTNVGSDVNGMPTPLPGMGQQQSLTASLQEPPSSHAALFVWLRGEKTGRTTSISAAPPAAAR
jgi:hypothetical protein